MSLAITASVTDDCLQSGDVCCMVFHKGKLYTGAEGGKLIVYNADLTIHQEIQAQYNTVNAICVWNDQLVTTGNDGLVKLWDLGSLRLKNTLTGHDNEVRKLFPTKDRLFSGDMNGKVKIWGIDGSCQFTLSCVEEVWDIAVSDGLCYTVRDKDITVTEVKYERGNVEDETKFVIADSFEGRPPMAVIGPILFFCDRAGTTIHMKDKSKSHADAGKLEGHTKIITSMETHGGQLYTGGYDKTVVVWDTANKKPVTKGTTVNSAVYSMAVADEGAVYVGLEKGYIVRMDKK